MVDAVDNRRPSRTGRSTQPPKNRTRRTASTTCAQKPTSSAGCITLVHLNETGEIPSAPAVTAADAVDPTWGKPAAVGSSLGGPPGMPTCPANDEPAVTPSRTRGRTARTRRRPASRFIRRDHRPDLPGRLDEPAAEDGRPDGRDHAVRGHPGRRSSASSSPSRKQSGGGCEATSCHFNTTDFVDTHVALVE
jgi:hypothetical protein